MKPILSAAAAAAATAAVALATSASGQSTPTTLSLVDHETHVALADVKPKGLPKKISQGDTLALGGRTTGDDRGTSNLVCTVTQPGRRAVFACHGTLELRRGSISFEGVTHANVDGDTFAVVGGTGDYEAAAGTMVTGSGKGDATKITLTLIQ